MADLPDLDTTQVSFLAYWNALNHGVSSIDPTEVTGAGTVTTSTAYDNGMEGEIDLGDDNDVRINWRVKNDGWFVAWLDRSESFGRNVGDATTLTGLYDITSWCNRYGGPATSMTQNTCERAIQDLQAALSNSGSITYNSNDVGLYNYEYPNATNYTVFYSESGGGTNFTGKIEHTSTIDLKWAVVTGIAGKDGVRWDTTGDDIKIATDVDSGNGYGAYDLIANGELPNPGTEISVFIPQNGSVATVPSVWA